MSDRGCRWCEIGSGWGFLAIRAAQRGATVTSTTLSGEQLALARTRVAEAGLADRVELLHVDFRDLTGTYDAVVSVEMVEAVGPEALAGVLRDRRPAAQAWRPAPALQAITMPHDQMLATSQRVRLDPEVRVPRRASSRRCDAIESNLAAHTSLYVAERRDLRLHYVETLRQWRSRFLASWDQVAALGFDERFRRLWELYLAYSEAGFRSGYLGREPAEPRATAVTWVNRPSPAARSTGLGTDRRPASAAREGAPSPPAGKGRQANNSRLVRTRPGPGARGTRVRQGQGAGGASGATGDGRRRGARDG